MKKFQWSAITIGTLLLFVILTILFFHVPISIFLWEQFRLETPARVFNSNPTLLVEIGDHYFNSEGRGVYDLERATEYFEAALAVDPEVSNAWHQLARIEFLNGNLERALEKINTQIGIHGDSFMASYYIRGLVHGFRGEYKEAEADFRHFLEWDPKNWAALNDLAWIYFKEGKYAEVERLANIGLDFNPLNPWLLTTKGVALINLSRSEEARDLLLRAERSAEGLSPEDWMVAYPGNDPAIASKALDEMRKVIEHNLSLVVDK